MQEIISVAVHTLPNLTVLSLSGCSKITDDGIELIAENLRKLRSLDLSWCPRVTDAALEYIACDLNHLEELTLDRLVIEMAFEAVLPTMNLNSKKKSKILSFNVTQSMYKLCTSQCQCLNVEKSLIESATLISRKIFFRIALQPRYFYGIDNGICQPPHSFLSPLQVCAHNRYRNRIHFYHVGLTHSLFEVVYSNPRLWTAAHLRHEEHANSFIGW